MAQHYAHETQDLHVATIGDLNLLHSSWDMDTLGKPMWNTPFLIKPVQILSLDVPLILQIIPMASKRSFMTKHSMVRKREFAAPSKEFWGRVSSLST